MISLQMYQPIMLGSSLQMDLSPYIAGWSRNIVRDGGDWIGDLEIIGEPDFLETLFYEHLGADIREKSGGFPTWRGMIYELELTVNGSSRRRSLDEIYNYVTAQYIKPDNTNATSAAALNQQSINRYGRREELLLLDGYTQVSAEARRDQYLKEYAWPVPRATGVMSGQGVSLRASICGYMLTAAWRYETAGDGSTDNVSDWVSEIIATDCQLLRSGKITSNTLQVTKETKTAQRVGDLLFDLAELGDASGNPWRIYTDTDRQVYYEQVDVTPQYYLINGKLYDRGFGGAVVDPWRVRPGVVRDLSYPVQKTEYDGWLSDSRDFYVSDVSCGTGAGLVLKTDISGGELDVLAAQAEYAGREQQADGGGGASTPGGKYEGRHTYELAGIKRKDWVLKTTAEKLAAKQSVWARRRLRRKHGTKQELNK